MALAGAPVDESNLNNLRDILSTYNKITEVCFNRCVSTLSYREVILSEEDCVNRCAGKLISSNQKIMGTFMQIQTKKQNEMNEEFAKEQENASAAMSVGLPQPPQNSDMETEGLPNAQQILSHAPPAADQSPSP